MRKFLYLALICGILSGAGIFLNFPKYPNLMIPAAFAILGMICALITIADKKTSGMLTLGGVLINLMPLLAIFMMPK
ncbi:membrane protein [Staphylococcus piscifermentans]|uniref:Uncharacterized protein n=1 Tax=Staphylococcus piscifermentans TaxID=70258 RepID=A0A239TSA2_9STAP|nr:hypothetical protein [Staphylococcus piscifermentans]RTX82988.1 hypothetical protein CD139_10250 [Staphylococcus piscifermentans]GEP84920.1 hypothetical protein SPI02_15050 [Staphylococcus piscifermentans]SNV00707.1 membrane protein [Staphylococcus piscifermentans]